MRARKRKVQRQKRKLAPKPKKSSDEIFSLFHGEVLNRKCRFKNPMQFDFASFETRLFKKYYNSDIDMSLYNSPNGISFGKIRTTNMKVPEIGSYVKMESLSAAEYDNETGEWRIVIVETDRIPPVKVANHIFANRGKIVGKAKAIQDDEPSYMGLLIPKRYKCYFDKQLFVSSSIVRGTRSMLRHYGNIPGYYYIGVRADKVYQPTPVELFAVADEIDY